MKTIRRYLYGEVLSSVSFVTLGFLALFFFFDLVDELRWVNQGGYQITQALMYVALAMPSHLYELFPITVLIGTIFVMASLAQSSEFTILRTSGLGPWMALRTLLVLGLAFVVTTFAVGDYVAPATERVAQLMKARYQGRLTTGQTGAWMKEKQDYSAYAVNIARMTPDGGMQKIRIFEFDNQGRMVSMTNAEQGRFNQDESWQLLQVHRSEFHNTDGERARVEPSNMAEYRWPTRISAEMASAALLKPDRMRTIDLFQYIQHLDANGQSAQSYEIEFWRKVFYPLSCLVMVVLALPFAYLHFRSGGIAAYVFGGVMAGISFFLLNNVFGYIGNLQNWTPWLVAASPGMIYSLLSLAAFGWLVLRR
ncbi:LPS export ABC transporter permease LptG [Curvibacter sp. HBC61]|uniref:LPS export ABC transporter permease LptG n=1 Tax=Curvibacter cyanobacteriorum TaxID=3026422 RepID=A0ABT5N5X1_9BURK|nr:LPS export ABC transporter permease LptG [Curvibacter sp. HBC61]MDD0840954.1 LPS export ABC transporter permease LptG [Curvibacter sp. HBC61]